MNDAAIRLVDLCDLIAEPVRPGTRPDATYLGLEHLAPGRLVCIGSGLASGVRSTTSAFRAGDVLYGKLRPYLDKAVLADRSGVCTTELLVLRSKTHVDPRFLVAIIHSPGFLEYAVSGTTGVQHPRTSWAHIREFEFPALKLEEQRRISNIFWLVHEAIVQSEKLINNVQELKRAAMQALFSRGLRGETQKETEIGPIPQSWTLVPCEQIFKLTSGKKRPKNLSNVRNEQKLFPVLGGNGVMGFSDKWYLDDIQSLIIGRVGEYCGAVHIASGKVWVTDNALYVKEWFNSNADIAFVGAFLKYYNLNRFKRIAGQPLITQGLINEHKIPIPHIEEQRNIISIFNAIDHKIDLHHRKRTLLENLFKALLHKIMTGKINVGQLDLPAVEKNRKEHYRRTTPNLRDTDTTQYMLYLKNITEET